MQNTTDDDKVSDANDQIVATLPDMEMRRVMVTRIELDLNGARKDRDGRPTALFSGKALTNR